MAITETKVREFFEKHFLEWMCSDIKNCIGARANFAVAALLMTYTENIGSFIEGHLGSSGTAEPDFNKFLGFFEFKGDRNYYKDFEIRYKDSKSDAVQRANIYKAFRCGLIHEYAPKFPCVIENHGDRIDYFTKEDAGIAWIVPPLSTVNVSSYSGYIPLPKAGKPFLRFHTNAYFRDFKNALNEVYDTVFNRKDPILISKAQTSLEKVLGRTLIFS